MEKLHQNLAINQKNVVLLFLRDVIIFVILCYDSAVTRAKYYIMKATLEAAVRGVSLHPRIVKELSTKTEDFPIVNS